MSTKWIALQGNPAADDITTAVTKYQSTTVPTAGHFYTDYFRFKEIGLQQKTVQLAGGGTIDEFHLWVQPRQKLLTETAHTAKGADEAASLWVKIAPDYVKLLSGQAEGVDPTPDQKTFLSNAAAYAIVYAQSLAEELAVGSGIFRPAVLTVEYDANLPSGQPSNSVVRGIYQAKLAGWTLTANGAVSFYNSQPSSQILGASRLRDFQIAVQADHNFSVNLPTGNVGITASGAFYDQNQTSPAILNVTPGAPVNGVTFTAFLVLRHRSMPRKEISQSASSDYRLVLDRKSRCRLQ